MKGLLSASSLGPAQLFNVVREKRAMLAGCGLHGDKATVLVKDVMSLECINNDIFFIKKLHMAPLL